MKKHLSQDPSLATQQIDRDQDTYLCNKLLSTNWNKYTDEEAKKRIKHAFDEGAYFTDPENKRNIFHSLAACRKPSLIRWVAEAYECDAKFLNQKDLNGWTPFQDALYGESDKHKDLKETMVAIAELGGVISKKLLEEIDAEASVSEAFFSRNDAQQLKDALKQASQKYQKEHPNSRAFVSSHTH